LKILALTNLYPPHFLGGYEIICGTIVRGLRERGHEVTVLTSNHLVETARTLPEDPGVERLLKIHGLYGHPWRGIHQLAALELHNNKVLREALRWHAPDLVHVWNMGGLSKSMLFQLQQSGIPTVFYLSDHWIAGGDHSDVWQNWWNRAHGTAPARLAREVLARTGLRSLCQKRAPTNPFRQLDFQRIYFCSRALRDATVAAGYDVGHGAIIYCPVNVEKLSGEPHPPEQPFQRLLYVGRLAEDKDVLTALRALARLRGQFFGSLSIYGKGDADYVELLKAFVRENQLPVNFGAATPDEMPEVYRKHDALIFTSKWDEPFALTPLEAMACGLPVIGTTTGGSAELFQHEKNALTYRAGDDQELAKRILQFCSDPELRVRCAMAGQCEVRQRCAHSVVLDQVEGYLEETLRVWKPVPVPHYNS
jgi:glycogen synthase